MEIKRIDSDGTRSEELKTYKQSYLGRLRDAFFWAAGRLNRTPSDLLDRLDGLHDDKGDLSVLWKSKPTPDEILAMNRAWGAVHEVNVTHFVRTGYVGVYGWLGYRSL